MNVVLSVYLNGMIDIDKINNTFLNIEYEPEMYSALAYKQERPKPTLFLWTSGRIRAMGGNSIKGSYDEITKFVKQLDDKKCIRGKSTIIDKKIENMVMTCSIEDKINLEDLYYHLPNSIYEPGSHPGLIYKPFENITAMIFTSGKFTIMGIKNEKEGIKAIELIFDLLKKFNRYC